MNIQLIHSKKEWQQAAEDLPLTFLQSWEWGQMHEAMGHPVLRVGFDGGVMTAVALSLGFGRNVLFAPQGPVLADETDATVVTALADSDCVRNFAREHNCIALRIEPNRQPSGLKRVADVSPAVTSVLDLTQSEEELLAGMKQKTRYNVRRASKKGVEVEFADDYSEELLDHWWKLVTETSERHGIGHHERGYYETMLTTLMSSGIMEVGIARHDGDLLGMTLNARYSGTTTYVHGANTHNKKNMMATYALQWEAIKRAQAAGSTLYDFYGIAPEDTPKHHLSGVTRFKKGFGGETINSLGTFETGIHALYQLYSLYKRFR